MPKKPGGNRIPSTAPILFRSAAGWAGASLLAVGSLFLVKFIGFSNLAGAQTTMGAFGLAGGFAHSLLVKSVGGKVSGQQELLLSIVWALSFLCGVTPLFFTSGMELKMAVITFYSFATFGALGGVATAFVLRRVFERPTYRGVIPCVLIWSFSLGFATVAGNAFGEGLQKFLPAAVAWSLAFVTMVLIIGAGSGYSIVQFLEGGRDEKEAVENRGIDQKASSKEENKSDILVLLLLTGPFFLNDFLNIYIQDWRWWLLADYTSVKLFPLLVVLWSIRSRKMRPSQFGLTLQPIVSFAAVFLVGSLATTFIGQNGYLVLNHFHAYKPLAGIPGIGSPFWNWVDLTAGLMMVGIFEELVFRGYLHTLLTRYTQNPLPIVGISAIVFGFIHWSGGSDQVLVALVAGAVFMTLYLMTRSLPAIMLAHFTTNFIEFAGIIPKEIFRFL